MTTLNRTLMASLFCISAIGIATADEPIHPLPRPTFAAGVVAPVVGGYGHLRTGGAASTAHESILRGRADVIRANGEYKLLVAEALRSYEEARSRRIDNDVKELAAQQERRRMWRAEQNERHERDRSRRELAESLKRSALGPEMTSISSEQVLETRAQDQLRLATNLINAGRYESGINSLVAITKTYAQTSAAQHAAEILTQIQG